MPDYKKDNYSQKKVLYNPKAGSMFLLIIAIGFIYLLFKNEHIRNLLLQYFKDFNKLM